MKLPRDLSGRDLVQALGVLGYKVTRQFVGRMRRSRYPPYATEDANG